MTSAAYEYHAAGERLDEHMRDCGLCSSGTACPSGDDAAEREFRAWRSWEREDASAADTYRRSASRW